MRKKVIQTLIDRIEQIESLKLTHKVEATLTYIKSVLRYEMERNALKNSHLGNIRRMNNGK
jgi:hypothetical protein